MKSVKVLSICTLLLLGLSTAFAGFVPLRTDVENDRPETEILYSGADRIEFEVRLPGIEMLEATLEGRNWDRIEIPGGGFSDDLGSPEVPNYNRMIAIPATAGVRVEFVPIEVTTLEDVDLMPAQGDDPADLLENKQPSRMDDAAYEKDEFYPSVEASSSEPAIMRGVRLVSVRMNPVRYNPVSKELKIAHKFLVKVYFEGTDQRNQLERGARPMSRSWAKLMSASIMNFDQLDLEIVPVGSYLIVCENDNYLLNTLLPTFIEWKKRKGHAVFVETFSPGASESTIKSIIQNFYNQSEIPPEFVLLVGDTDGNYALQGWPVGWWPADEVDHPFSQLEGNDILADVAVGRFAAYDDYQYMTLQNKVILYEKMPLITEDEWYHQGCVIAGNSYSGISTIQVGRWLKTRMFENQFTRVDTFWYWMGGSVETTTDNAFRDGISVYNYRGNYMMENFSVNDVNYLENGRDMPFVITITCGTGGFAGSTSFMEQFAEVGSPTSPKGAIAAVGTATLETHTRQNNTIAYGTWGGIFEEGLTQAGNALNRGKLELYNTFQAHNSSTVSSFSKYAALAGDPGVELFNAPIRYMSCTIPASMTFGENSLTLTVNETGIGPLEEATVCFYKENDLQEVGLTDAAGQVTLPMGVASQGNVKVTITRQNFYPIVDSLNVIQADVAVGYYDHSIDDDSNGSSSGDGDGFINPNETIEIPLVFKNYGSSVTATSISVTATSTDDYITIDDGYESFPNMSAGGTGSSSDDIDITIAPDCPHGHIVHLDFETNSSQGSWDGGLDVEVISSDMDVRSISFAGGDTILTAGATGDFVLTVGNVGGKAASSLTAVLTSNDPYIAINDNYAAFGTINPDGIGDCSGNPFNITTDEATPPGYCAEFTVDFTTSGGAEQNVAFDVAVGEKTQNDPQGPDEYGYYCFDNTDMLYSEMPVYNWVEINPNYGGTGTQLAINDPSENQDMSVTIQLPFTFRYYGQDVDDITVCSNGWIAAIADNSYADFRNYPIPSMIGPDAMIAPFWDDLITWSSGKVYAWYDDSNHRFIVEWSHLKNYGSSTQQVFEVILYDPVYYPTPTGDSEIVFQYQDITDIYGPSDDNKYSTVGIENFDQRDGIEIVYWHAYDDPAAAELQDGRAYKFTTSMTYNLIGSDIDIELTYQSGSPVPEAGGNLYFDVYAGNVSGVAQDYDAWLAISYQGGEPTTMVQRSFTNFLPGWAINRPNMYFPVPGSYAAGNYTFYGRVGDHPDDIWDESSFPFNKLGMYNSGVNFALFVPSGVPNPFDIIEGSDVSEAVPDEFELLGSYPNPFNPTTAISYQLPVVSFVNLAIYDISGRKVADLVNGSREAGVHEVTFDASDLASGIYLYRLEAGSFSATGKMVLMK